MKSVLIKIYQDKLWFNKSLPILLSDTNLPFKFFKFSSRPIYWLLEMKSYERETATLSVSVINFKATDVESWDSQQPKSKVSKIYFIHLDWTAFCQCLAFYQSEVKELLPHDRELQEKASEKHHQHHVNVPINKLKIGFGNVSFYKKFKWSKVEEEVVIQQPFMLPELEHVKPYFSKVLGKRTIDVTLNLIIKNGEVSTLSAMSEDLASINRDSVYVLKTYKIEEVKRTLKDTLDNKMLVDLESFSRDNDFGNIDIFERDILFHVLEGNDIRNKAQLNYLSDILLDNQKLLLTMEPQFGFVFIVNGMEMVHCVWELLDSHATYVWSFNSKAFRAHELKLLEREFVILAQHGRSHYRNNITNTKDKYFNVIQHHHSDDPIIDHFGKWRNELEKLFV